jgi:hypothetical protein
VYSADVSIPSPVSEKDGWRIHSRTASNAASAAASTAACARADGSVVAESDSSGGEVVTALHSVLHT